MNFTADFDLASFGLGFAVAPVAYLVFGAAVYTIFCTREVAGIFLRAAPAAMEVRPAAGRGVLRRLKG